jgi:hypothetical protein
VARKESKLRSQTIRLLNTMTEQEKLWVTDCAARLKLVAGATPEKRREFLDEEISRKLKELPKQKQKRHLEALLSQFPVDGQAPQALPPPPPPEGTKPPVATFDEVFDCFLRLAEELTEPNKAEVVSKLGKVGLTTAALSLPAEVTEKLRKELSLAANQQLQPRRVAEIATFLVELVCKLDQAAFGALRQLAPNCALLKAESLRRLLAQYIVADQPRSAPSTRALEILVGAMLRALLIGGNEFGSRYLDRMKPENIWEVVKAEAKMFENKRELAWERYKELSEEYATNEQINQLIREAMGATILSGLKDVIAG